MLTLHSSSGGVEEEESPDHVSRARGTESPSPIGMSVLQQERGCPVRFAAPPHPPAQSPGQPGDGRATPAKGPERSLGAARGKQEDRGLPVC